MVDCPKCGKSFDSEEDMAQHLEDYDHSNVSDNDRGLKDKLMESNLVGISVLAIFLIGGGFFFINAVSNAAEGLEASENPSNIISTEDEPVLGNSNSTVKIAYFGDYGCPMCNRFEQNIFPGLREEILDTGQAEFIKKNFPVVTDQSPMIAEASQSVWNQVKDNNPEIFWEWHDHIYDNQGGEHSGWATKDTIIRLSEDVDGIDIDQLEEDLDSNTYRSEVQGDQREAQRSGATGTPTFIIFSTETGESQTIVGPQPLTRFQSAITAVI